MISSKGSTDNADSSSAPATLRWRLTLARGILALLPKKRQQTLAPRIVRHVLDVSVTDQELLRLLMFLVAE
jgi:hypothetical protein